MYIRALIIRSKQLEKVSIWPSHISQQEFCQSQVRNFAEPNASALPNPTSDSIWTRFVQKFSNQSNNLPKKVFSKDQERLNSLLLDIAVPKLYNDSATAVDYLGFIKKYNLADTFHSWSKITLLHMWIILTRLCHEEQEFYHEFRDDLMLLFWKDLEDRLNEIKKFRALSGVTRKSIRKYSYQLHAIASLTFAELDEGLLTDDATLAAALWRFFYPYKKSYDIVQLNEMVQYVRLSVRSLQLNTLDNIVKSGIKWKPV